MAIKKMTADEFFRLYAAGERDFMEVEITDADMSRATGWEVNAPVGQAINGCCFSEGNYSRTNFSANDMRGNAFGSCQMSQCIFTAADLTGSAFSYSNLGGSTFEGAKLIRVDLQNTILGGCDFTGADLTKANLTGADLEGIASFAGALFCQTTMPDGSIVEGPTVLED